MIWWFSPYFWVDTQMPFQILGLSVSVASADWRLHGWLDGRVCRTLPGYLACWVTCWSTYLVGFLFGKRFKSFTSSVENRWSTIYLCRVFPCFSYTSMRAVFRALMGLYMPFDWWVVPVQIGGYRISPIYEQSDSIQCTVYQSLQLFICRKGPFWIFTITLGGTGIWIHPNYRFHMAYTLGCTFSFHASQKILDS